MHVGAVLGTLTQRHFGRPMAWGGDPHCAPRPPMVPQLNSGRPPLNMRLTMPTCTSSDGSDPFTKRGPPLSPWQRPVPLAGPSASVGPWCQQILSLHLIAFDQPLTGTDARRGEFLGKGMAEVIIRVGHFCLLKDLGEITSDSQCPESNQ